MPLSAILDAAATTDTERTPVFTTQWNVTGDEAQLQQYYSLVNDQNPGMDQSQPSREGQHPFGMVRDAWRVSVCRDLSWVLYS